MSFPMYADADRNGEGRPVRHSFNCVRFSCYMPPLLSSVPHDCEIEVLNEHSQEEPRGQTCSGLELR